MIQIDMPMPTNCLDCPACNEYLTCAIPVNGRKLGENDVREFGQSRPDWCPMKDQEADKWISVTERLPEVRNAVLCYSPHHNNIWALSLHEDGEWYYWIPMYEKYNPDFDGPITHWRPLPEHPKEGR